MKIVDKKRKLY